AESHARRVRQLRDQHARRLTVTLRRFFREQAERVVRRYLHRYGLQAKGEAHDLLDDDETTRLARVLVAALGVSARDAMDLAAAFLAEEPLSENERITALLSASAQRVVGINAYTRRMIQEALVAGRAAGYTPYQIAYGVAKDGFRGLADVVAETYKGRAETIARTELGTVMNLAAVQRVERAGLTQVQLMDGPGCHLFTHTSGPLANGLVVSLAEAQRYPLSHINCRRVVLPYRPEWGGLGEAPTIVQVPQIVRAA